MNDNTAPQHIWVPLRYNEVSPETIKVINAFVDKMPDLPLCVKKAIDIASDEKSNLDELVSLVSSDPVIVANILRIVNSSYYGLSHKTDNLHIAVVLLGLKEIIKIIIRSYFTKTPGAGKTYKKYNTKELWMHSYLVSICAENFINESDQQRRGVFLTLGLLHDISKFSLCEFALDFKKSGIKPHKDKDTPMTDYILEKEEMLFGINHAIMGKILAQKWNLSDRIVSVLEYHHYPSFFGLSEIPAEFEEEISVICISDLIVNKFLKGTITLPEPHPHYLMR